MSISAFHESGNCSHYQGTPRPSEALEPCDQAAVPITFAMQSLFVLQCYVSGTPHPPSRARVFYNDPRIKSQLDPLLSRKCRCNLLIQPNQLLPSYGRY